MMSLKWFTEESGNDLVCNDYDGLTLAYIFLCFAGVNDSNEDINEAESLSSSSNGAFLKSRVVSLTPNQSTLVIRRNKKFTSTNF